jgi:hypothetical protein
MEMVTVMETVEMVMVATVEMVVEEWENLLLIFH